ncbi:cytochrome c oxidase subunit II [Tropicibacter naphthalenivorans]|uniref:Cytochrome c oxidase subunit 2 n=1 Tax=Tropicibacter naphthalenivorans TaxID=441103 RepID=A0A0P1G1R3_9RHOB|nr:cytochrome c oxidase subunit II [Tropicibacter naphthalenivorans]CUH75746.1 Cytochrome c oxidase subunit 2 precursor [Tropicibacter naphthalenivorans]SMC42508.1 cytochrome c oxidase subunit 2 [Tropicibacter naphthalenivorans]
MQLKTMLTGLLSAFVAAPAMAQSLEVVGKPTDGDMGFQPAATKLAEDLQWLDGMILVIITLITLFVTGLLAWCIVRYNRKANPTPGSFTHNSPLEVAWTIGPIVILIFIGSFSLPVLFDQQEIPEADITIKVTGYQWYWGYEYIGEDLSYDANMIGAPYTDGDYRKTPEVVAQLEEAGYAEEDFLLATDTAVVVPVGKTVVMRVTGGDVIHSWTIPAFGVKQDAVPGRTAELHFTPNREGVYFGQCSELCGIAHAYMPITVKVVSEAAYDAWLARSKDEGGYVDVREVLTN